MAKGLPYNGWTEEVRHDRDKYYYPARDKGVLRAATSCDACGISFEGKPVPYHAEEYGPTLEDYWVSCVPICNRCHAMLHARFATPNLWRLFLHQLASRSLDAEMFPQSSQIAALLSKFKNRKDIAPVEMPADCNEYLGSLPMSDYCGPPKVATLLVVDQMTGEILEVPDWTIYAENLEKMTDVERKAAEMRGLRVDDFLADRILVSRNAYSRRQYVKLYMKNRKG